MTWKNSSIHHMTPPAWIRNKSKYRVYMKPDGSANVIHFSPSKKKITVRVPKSKASNIPAFLKNHFGPPKNLSIRRMSNGRVVVTRSSGIGQSSMVIPVKNPSQKNINMFVNAYFKPLSLLTGPRGPKPVNFFQNSTNNGRTGTALTSLNNKGGLRTVYNVTKGAKSIHLGVGKLGGGVQAVVYLGYTDKAATKPVSIKVFPFDRDFPPTKQPANLEFDIGSKLHTIVPRHVPKYIALEKAYEFAPLQNMNKLTGPFNKSNQAILLSEYFNGGDLHNWIKKVSPRLRENDLIDIIRQVLQTLIKIRDKYPSFRHNDLHTGNIFIDDTGVKPRAAIADYGLACLTPGLTNPTVNKGYYLNSGIGPTTDPRYDAHMFLNLLREVSGSYPRLKVYLNLAVPVGYRGSNDTYVKSGRLKYGLPDYPGLPSTRAMLRMLIPAVTQKNLANALAKRVKKPTSANLVRAPATKGTDAANIASAALANMPGVTVTKSTTLSAANFLKLSPKSKQTYLATKKAVVKKPIATLQFKKVVGNATATKKTNATAYLKMLKMKPSPHYNLNKFFKTPRPPAKNVLNRYTRNKNVTTLTTRNLRKVLTTKGYPMNNAKRESRAWAKAWTNSVAKRRVNLKLSKGTNGRIRGGTRLLEGLKRDQLVNMAKKHGLTHSGKTKAQLINSLWKN